MDNQLKLNKKELNAIGFKKTESKGDEMNRVRVFFKIETTNGYFYYNPNEDLYVWYHETIIGDISNTVHLDIEKKSELFVLLGCFKSEFNLIF